MAGRFAGGAAAGDPGGTAQGSAQSRSRPDSFARDGKKPALAGRKSYRIIIRRMSLNADAVRRLATLARLDLDPAEQAALQADLNAVLGLIDRLQSVDTQGVAPLTHPQALALRLRDDAVTESDARAALQAGAPKVEAGLYLVPRVIE